MKIWNRTEFWTTAGLLLVAVIVAVFLSGPRMSRNSLYNHLSTATQSSAPISSEPKPSAGIGIVRPSASLRPAKKAAASK
jgi:hypothetical protein